MEDWEERKEIRIFEEQKEILINELLTVYVKILALYVITLSGYHKTETYVLQKKVEAFLDKELDNLWHTREIKEVIYMPNVVEKVGMKALTGCRTHSDCIVYHNNDIPCPYCVIKELVATLQEDYEILQQKYDIATAGAAGSL